MQTSLRKIGNSTGMILPGSILGEIGVTIGAAMDLRVENGTLIATPVRKVREGWAEDAERVAAAGVTAEEAEWMALGNERDSELEW